MARLLIHHSSSLSGISQPGQGLQSPLSMFSSQQWIQTSQGQTSWGRGGGGRLPSLLFHKLNFFAFWIWRVRGNWGLEWTPSAPQLPYNRVTRLLFFFCLNKSLIFLLTEQDCGTCQPVTPATHAGVFWMAAVSNLSEITLELQSYKKS